MIVLTTDTPTLCSASVTYVNVAGGGQADEMTGLFVPLAAPTCRQKLHTIVCRLFAHGFTRWRVVPGALERRCVHCGGYELRSLTCVR